MKKNIALLILGNLLAINASAFVYDCELSNETQGKKGSVSEAKFQIDTENDNSKTIPLEDGKVVACVVMHFGQRLPTNISCGYGLPDNTSHYFVSADVNSAVLALQVRDGDVDHFLRCVRKQ